MHAGGELPTAESLSQHQTVGCLTLPHALAPSPSAMTCHRAAVPCHKAPMGGMRSCQITPYMASHQVTMSVPAGPQASLLGHRLLGELGAAPTASR